MALRTIADLPALDIETVKDRPDLASNLAESLFEISYMEAVDRYDSYKSRHIKFKGLSSLILDGVSNNDFDFYGHKTFYGGVSISNMLAVSGDFYVNKDVPPDIWNDYHVVMNAGDMIFNSHNMLLSSENMTAYVDNGQIRNYSGDTTIIDWNPSRVNVNVPLYARNISCANLTAASNAVFNGAATFNGTAVFTNVINGCALCAKWADLAELYKSDADYPAGTLVKFGGEAEITIADDYANAVITDKPGLVLNGSGDRDGIYKGIALVGRTPVMVVGPVKKFDRLVANPKVPGTAKCAENPTDVALAVAFGDVQDGQFALVECAVQLSL